MTKIYHFSIPFIPDCTHFRYTRMVTGDIAGHIYERAEQLLRMIGRFEPGQIACCIRAFFDPNKSRLQERLKWTVSLYTAPNISPETVNALVTDGPLSGFYDFSDVNKFFWNYDGFDAACEILRYEETLKPLVPSERNPRINFRHYYAVKPLSPRMDNDYLMLDQTLSGVKEPVLMEILVTSAEVKEVRETHFEWVSRLLAINAYDDDTYVPGAPEDFSQGQGLATSSGSIYSERNSRSKDPLADEFLRENQELFQNLRKDQLRFAIKVFSKSPEICLTVASTLAESCFSEGIYQLIAYARGSPWFEPSCTESSSGIFGEDPYDPELFSGAPPEKTKILHRMARMATAEELAGAFRLPVAGTTSPRCMPKSTDPKEVPAETSILFGHDLETGVEPKKSTEKILANILDQKDQRVPATRLPVALLNKHLFVAGATGSGKTTAIFNLLVQLYRHGIPFLVIEPAKAEYRVLKTLSDNRDPTVQNLARDLRVYTPGNETISPFRMNPLSYPENISRDEHIGQLMSCFKAGMPLFGPLEAVISDSIEEVYRRDSEGGSFPMMEDLVAIVKDIMESKGYEGEVQSNLRAAIEVRLGNLTKRSIGKIFSSEKSLPSIEELINNPTIIEMDHLDGDTACLLTLFILSALRAEFKKRPSGSPLTHVIVIEEAHNIVGRAGEAKNTEDSVDPKAFAAQYISRMLAELRALGEGIVIADQLPSAVAPEVVKNTGTKLAGRLVALDDREFLGGTMLLGPAQIEEMARLSVGEAYIYHEDLYAPRRCRALDAYAYLDLKNHPFPMGDEILPHLEKDAWFQAGIRKQLDRLNHDLNHLNEKLDDFQKKLEVALNWIEAIQKGSKEDEDTDTVLHAIGEVENELKRSYSLFYQESFEPVYKKVRRWGDNVSQKIVEMMDEIVAESMKPRVRELMDWARDLKEKLS